MVTLLITRVRSLSTTFWLPILPAGSGAGLAMTSGPLPGEPPAGLGMTGRGMTAEWAVAEAGDPPMEEAADPPTVAEAAEPGSAAEPQAASPTTTSITPPS